MSLWRQSLPIIVPSFVNKCGNIGLALVPMLLVERGVESGAAALIIGGSKSAQLLGSWLGGALCDRIAPRWVVIASFVMTGLGLGLLPLAHGLIALCALAFLANLGNCTLTSPLRLLIADSLPPHHHRLGFGWLRTASNAGSIVAYGVGSVATAWGVLTLMEFNAATSLAAVGAGLFLLPAETRRPTCAFHHVSATGFSGLRLYWLAALIVAGYGLLYESYMTGIAARCRILLGDDALQAFSVAMMINTGLCALMAVTASRYLERTAITFPLGIILTSAGAAIGTASASHVVLFLGALVLTLGEIVFTSTSHYILVRLAPMAKRGRWLGVAMLVAGLGRAIGAALAFPLVVTSTAPTAFFAIVGTGLLFFCAAGFRSFRRFDRHDRNPVRSPIVSPSTPEPLTA